MEGMDKQAMPEGGGQEGGGGAGSAMQMIGDIGKALGTLQSAMAQGGAPKPIVEALSGVLSAYDQFVATLEGGGGGGPAEGAMNSPEQGARGGAMPVG